MVSTAAAGPRRRRSRAAGLGLPALSPQSVGAESMLPPPSVTVALIAAVGRAGSTPPTLLREMLPATIEPWMLTGIDRIMPPIAAVGASCRPLRHRDAARASPSPGVVQPDRRRRRAVLSATVESRMVSVAARRRRRIDPAAAVAAVGGEVVVDQAVGSSIVPLRLAIPPPLTPRPPVTRTPSSVSVRRLLRRCCRRGAGVGRVRRRRAWSGCAWSRLAPVSNTRGARRRAPDRGVAPRAPDRHRGGGRSVSQRPSSSEDTSRPDTTIGRAAPRGSLGGGDRLPQRRARRRALQVPSVVRGRIDGERRRPRGSSQDERRTDRGEHVGVDHRGLAVYACPCATRRSP